MVKTTLKELVKKFEDKQVLIHVIELPDEEQCDEYYTEELEDYEEFENFDELEELLYEDDSTFADVFLIASDGRENFRVFDNYDSELKEILDKYGNKCFVEEEE